MEIEYIIVQAGGKGTRLEHLTYNKPKALVPINNLPMLFHVFRKYHDKRFIIIGDYKFDVLKSYLETFASVPYLLVDAKGAQGTCGGIQEALSLIPDKKSFMLIWSDLIVPDNFSIPENIKNYIGISKDFVCRWTYNQKIFSEQKSREQGVAGLFVFKNKEELKNIPKEGEFVRFLQQEGLAFEEIGLYGTKEFGLISEYKKLEVNRCRPFNRIREVGGKLLKEGITEQGKQLAQKEQSWYQYVKERGFDKIPSISTYVPLTMEKINGKNIFEYDLSYTAQKEILKNIVDMLKKLHSISSAPTDYFSIRECYYNKTFARLNKIQNMVPHALNESIVVNGIKCRNIFFFKKYVDEFIRNYTCKEFLLIHGDCTFSNIMLKNDAIPILIDPRGYFGYSTMFGDVNYDWAKVYYSIIGNYDQFNLKRFNLRISDNGVEIKIESNGWEQQEEYFFELLGDEIDRKTIKMLHAIIWLSLTTYAWEDYDSICGAFYIGLLQFEEALNELY